jgi:tetratricopeptide (TPR) repeat protein
MLKWIKSKFAVPGGNGPSPEVAATAGRVLALFEHGALQEAETALHDALRAEPSAKLARMLGALYASQQRHDEAVDALYQAFELEPRHAATANLIGVCHSLMMRFEEASIYYGMALESDPSMTDAYANSGWNSRLLGRPEAADFFREWLSRTRATRRPQATEPASGKLKLDNVTLCCLDCAYYALAADALGVTLSKCHFAEALFFSDRDCPVNGVRFVPIERITSSAQYSNFMIHELHEYIDTDYVLIIQYDGFVLNPLAWDPQFLQYDYIGAKISINKRSIVGNGGFSLRSRRLLRALRDDPEIKRYDASREPYSEDLAICDTYREILESRHEIRFAPEAVADRFSAELTPPTMHNFGFHNLIHLIGLYENQFELPERCADGAVEMVFRASTELGAFAARRQIELRGNDNFRPQTA